MTYSSRLIKTTALITDTKALMSAWDLDSDIDENLQAAQENNIFGNASRSRVKNILDIFNQRYFYDPAVGKALVKLVQSSVPASWINPLLFYFSAKNDITLRDIVLEVVNPRRKAGFYDIHVDHVIRQLRDWSAKRLTTKPWNDVTINSIARHALATLRDFGVLEGANQKRFTPFILPIESFIFITFDLMKNTGSGDKVLHSLEWGLFYLKPNDVEKFFIEAHQQRLCEYFAAGEVIRLEFPFATYTELADALIKRSRS